MSISLDTLMTLAGERSRTKRHALLRAVTEMFFAVPERNAAEMTLFDDVMDMVLAGHPSKNIAADLGISQRTVENHRAAIMQRMGVKSLPELARLVVVAGGS